jgi:ABC-2 type transport system permease protein
MTTATVQAPVRGGHGLGERLRWALRDGLLIAGRDVSHWVREPQLILWTLLFPIIFVLLFAYVLGSSMQVAGGGSYQQFLMPGMFVQTMAFGLGETVAAVQADNAKGVMDRFRSMPIAPSAVVLGRVMANMLYSVISLVVMLGCGLLVGWRWNTGLGGLALGVSLLLLLRLAMMWLGIILGLKAKSPEMANGLFGLLYPITMLSNAFASPELMPGWLGAIATWNPLSWTTTATREAFGNPGAVSGGWLSEHAVMLAVMWPLVVTAITLPFAVRAFQRLSR